MSLCLSRLCLVSTSTPSLTILVPLLTHLKMLLKLNVTKITFPLCCRSHYCFSLPVGQNSQKNKKDSSVVCPTILLVFTEQHKVIPKQCFGEAQVLNLWRWFLNLCETTVLTHRPASLSVHAPPELDLGSSLATNSGRTRISEMLTDCCNLSLRCWLDHACCGKVCCGSSVKETPTSSMPVLKESVINQLSVLFSSVPKVTYYGEIL